ncbi:MAG: DUF2238 domain-containing protein [Wenzhouxiangellaceae bacterium]|nr:DUF2238 domain-containing protein [Wenzhouxiangellaceae bacterium]
MDSENRNADGRGLPALLLALFGAFWLAMAWSPRFRADWALENALVAVIVPLMIWGYRRLRFSDLAYGCLFVFLSLHVLGSHFTYAEVPYDAWSRQWLGFSVNELLGFERNHFDRLVHFLFGVLLAPTVVELLAVKVMTHGVWRLLVPISVLAALSATYELIEWFAAIVFGGDLGMAYLGTQGDEWDGHKDMALAIGGAIVSVAVQVRFRPAAAAVPVTRSG